MSPLRFLYTLAVIVAVPFAWWRLARRTGIKWRHFCGYIPPAQSGALPGVWLHMVSVGEAAAADGLIRYLQQAGYSLTLTHTTAAAGDWLRQRYEGVQIYPLPLDLPGATARFMCRLRPRVGIIMEAEYWPNLLAAAQAGGVFLMLANARLGRTNARRYARVRPLMQEMVSRYDIIAAQTRADGRRLKFFGARRVCVVGNLKFDRDINAVLQERGKILRQRLRREAADKMIMLVAGTRAGEEEILTAAMDDDFMRRFFVIIAPRHPPRGKEVAALLRARGWRIGRRGSGDEPAMAQNGYVADTLGEMDMFYACCDRVIIGGSFLPFGGQNPIEAMAAGAPAVMGPFADNYAVLTRLAVKRGALRQAADAAAAIATVRQMTEAEAQQCGEAARQLCDEQRGALSKHIELAAQLLSTKDK